MSKSKKISTADYIELHLQAEALKTEADTWKTRAEKLEEERETLCRIRDTLVGDKNTLQDKLDCLEHNYAEERSQSLQWRRKCEDIRYEAESLMAIISVCITKGVISTENIALTLLQNDPAIFLKYLSVPSKEVIQGKERLFKDNSGEEFAYTDELLSNIKKILNGSPVCGSVKIDAIKYVRETGHAATSPYISLVLAKNFVEAIMDGKVA